MKKVFILIGILMLLFAFTRIATSTYENLTRADSSHEQASQPAGTTDVPFIP